MRFDNSPDLFGKGTGIATCGDFTCALCRTEYNTGNDEAEDYSGESIRTTIFADVEICENCFEKIESEILRRMPDILAWYHKILKIRQAAVEQQLNSIATLGG